MIPGLLSLCFTSVSQIMPFYRLYCIDQLCCIVHSVHVGQCVISSFIDKRRRECDCELTDVLAVDITFDNRYCHNRQL